MIFGSSRVYSINPLVIKKYLGGRSYNAGVGTARIEDQLGFLLYLERIKKLPKHVILGLDFYSFNQNVETNKYFLINKELNFLQKQVSNDLYFAKFLSIDALRASYKTLGNFLKNSKDKPRFNTYGSYIGTEEVFTYYPKHIKNLTFTQKEVEKGYRPIKTIKYEIISEKRMQYVQDIVSLCQRNNIICTVFTTPLSTQILSKITSEPRFTSVLQKFKYKLSTITEYYDFLTDNYITENRFFFGGDTMHTTTFAGNLILARLFNDKNISLPKNFGVFVPKKEVRP